MDYQKECLEGSKKPYNVKSGIELAKRDESGLLLKIEWAGKSSFDDGKQSNELTGASHPGCCKQ